MEAALPAFAFGVVLINYHIFFSALKDFGISSTENSIERRTPKLSYGSRRNLETTYLGHIPKLFVF